MAKVQWGDKTHQPCQAYGIISIIVTKNGMSAVNINSLFVHFTHFVLALPNIFTTVCYGVVETCILFTPLLLEVLIRLFPFC